MIWTSGYASADRVDRQLRVAAVARAGRPRQHVQSRARRHPAPSWSLRLRWIFLAAVPSGLLVAVTSHISTDVAAAPLLWVLPLSLYLLTWVVVFQKKPLISHKWIVMALQPLAIAGVVILFVIPASSRLLLMLGGQLLVVLHHRHGRAWRAGAHASGRGSSDGLLCRAVARRHDRRIVRRPHRALHLQLGGGVSDAAGAGGDVPAAADHRPVAHRPGVLAGRGARSPWPRAAGDARLADCAAHRRQSHHDRGDHRAHGRGVHGRPAQARLCRGAGAGDHPPLSERGRPRRDGAFVLRHS